MQTASAQDVDVRRAMARAGILESRGEYTQAAGLYEEALAGLPEDDALGLRTRRTLVGLYFDHEDIPDAQAALLSHLEALEQAGEVDKGDRVNWRLSLALQHIIENGDAEVWHAAVSEIVPEASGVQLRDRLLSRIDALMEQAGEDADAAVLLEQVLGDLFLLSPDLESSRRIQWRRIAWLESQQRWDDAIAAAELDVLLGTRSESGPHAAIDRCVGLMQSAQHSDEQIETWRSQLYIGQDIALVEDAMVSMASERLELWASLDSYQAAVLHAMSGHREHAIESLTEVLAKTGTAEGEIDRDLARAAWVICLVKGHWDGSNPLLAWMSLPESNRQTVLDNWGVETLESELVIAMQDRSAALKQAGSRGLLLVLPVRSQVALLRPLQQRVRTQIGQWIERAEQDNEADAELAWRFLYLDLNPRIDAQRELLREWAIEKSASLGSDNAEQWLERLSDRVDRSELKQELVYSIAMLRYWRGQLEEAVVAFDKLIELNVQDDDAREDWHLARVIALAGLEQWDVAAEAIDELPMDTPERLYAAGWLAARTSNNALALTRLRELRDRHPDSPEAGLAVSLLAALEAAP